MKKMIIGAMVFLSSTFANATDWGKQKAATLWTEDEQKVFSLCGTFIQMQAVGKNHGCHRVYEDESILNQFVDEGIVIEVEKASSDVICVGGA